MSFAPAMKVLKYLDTIDRGGAEVQVLDICRNAARFGLEITLATRGGVLEDDFRATGVEIVKLKRRAPVDPLLAGDLRSIIKARSIDVVHGYQAVDGIHLYLACLGLAGVRKVLSFQGFVQHSRERRAANFLIPRMDANIVVSRGLKNWLESDRGLQFGENTTVIYNGADPTRLASTGRSLRAELGLREKARLVGMVGNFYRDKRKDQMTVCRAIAQMPAGFEDVHYVFAGGVEAGAEHKLDECRAIVRAAGIQDRVHFLGPRTDVPDILAALDVFVFSSLHEGLPVAVSEAMLAGVAMIVSDIEPLLEATNDGEAGEVFPVGNNEALATKLKLLLSDETRSHELAQAALAYAEDHFSIDAHLGALTKLYETAGR